MKPSHIEHIGIAVRCLEKAIPFFEALLGVSCHKIEEAGDQYTKTAFFRLGDTKIELLESTSAKGPVAKFIEKRGEGLHHIAFAVQDVSTALEEMERQGIQAVDSGPRPGAEGMEIAFLHPKSAHGVLVELCSQKPAR